MFAVAFFSGNHFYSHFHGTSLWFCLFKDFMPPQFQLATLVQVCKSKRAQTNPSTPVATSVCPIPFPVSPPTAMPPVNSTSTSPAVPGVSLPSLVRVHPPLSLLLLRLLLTSSTCFTQVALVVSSCISQTLRNLT